jgi:hypothetical protein
LPAPIDADILLRHILRRALRKAGLETFGKQSAP